MGKRKINVISAALIYIVGSFFTQGLRFITLPIFSRMMSTSDFGLYSSYETWIAMLTVIIGLQTTASIANAYVDYGPLKIRQFVYSVSLTGLISGSIIWAILFLFQGLFTALFEISFLSLSLGIIQCIFTYFFTMLISEYRMLDLPVKYLVFSIGNSVINVGLAIVFLYHMSSDKYTGRIYASTLAAFVCGIAAVIIIIKSADKKIFDREYIKYAVKLCSPLIFHAFAAIVLGRCDQMMLLKMKSSSESGIYSYGNNFAHIIYVLYTACNQAFIPWYYKKLKEKKQRDAIRLSKLYMVLFSCGFLVFICILPEVITFISAEEYRNVIYTAPILSMGFYINFLYTFPVNYEFYQKKTKYIAMGTVLAACLNAIFNYFLIPYYGGVGAAAATALSYFVLFIVHLFVAKKVIKGYEMPMYFFVMISGVTFLGFLAGYIAIGYFIVRIICGAICLCGAIVTFLYMKKQIYNH